jgi:hypothetical protein
MLSSIIPLLFAFIGSLGSAPTNAACSTSHSGDPSHEAVGVYVVTRAGGRPLPYPFRADLGAGEMQGDLTGARLTLRADGGYDADLVVRVAPGLLAALPGMPAEGVTRTVHDTGRYEARDGRIVLTPQGMLTRRYDARLFGSCDGTRIAFTSADVRSRGEQYQIALDLVRVR